MLASRFSSGKYISTFKDAVRGLSHGLWTRHSDWRDPTRFCQARAEKWVSREQLLRVVRL